MEKVKDQVLKQGVERCTEQSYRHAVCAAGTQELFFLADFMSQILQFLSAKVTTVNSVQYYKPVTSVLTVCFISVKAGRPMYVQC